MKIVHHCGARTSLNAQQWKLDWQHTSFKSHNVGFQRLFVWNMNMMCTIMWDHSSLTTWVISYIQTSLTTLMVLLHDAFFQVSTIQKYNQQKWQVEQDNRQFTCVCWFAFIADPATELFPSRSGSSVSLEDQEGEPWTRLAKVQITLHFLCSVSSDFWSRVPLHDLLHNWSLIFYSKTGLHASYTHDISTWHTPLRASITMAVPGKVRKPLRDLGLSKLSSDLGL